LVKPEIATHPENYNKEYMKIEGETLGAKATKLTQLKDTQFVGRISRAAVGIHDKRHTIGMRVEITTLQRDNANVGGASELWLEPTQANELLMCHEVYHAADLNGRYVVVDCADHLMKMNYPLHNNDPIIHLAKEENDRVEARYKQIEGVSIDG